MSNYYVTMVYVTTKYGEVLKTHFHDTLEEAKAFAPDAEVYTASEYEEWANAENLAEYFAEY